MIKYNWSFSVTKQSFAFFAALMLLLASSAVRAQQIAVVDIQMAILNSSFGQQQLNALSNDPSYADLISTAQSIEADIASLDSQAQSEASNWTNERFQQYTRQREFKVADLQLTSQKIQSERERVINAILEAMNDRAIGALEEIIEEENISILLRESAVYSADAEHNVTRLLVEKLSN